MLRDRILDLRCAPGARLSEQSVIDDLGLGRTPIREAFNRLATEGLLTISPQKGAVVRPLDVSEINQIFDAYLIAGRIEATFCNFADANLAADTAACQRQHVAAIEARQPLDVSYWNYRLHVRIAAATGNDLLADFCRRVNSQARRLNAIVYKAELDAPDYPAPQRAASGRLLGDLHRAIVAANRSELLAAMDRQAISFRERFARVMARFPDNVASFSAAWPG